MSITITCKRCKELIVASDEDDLMAQVEAHARDHGGARGVHIPTRDRILTHLRPDRGEGDPRSRSSPRRGGQVELEPLSAPPAWVKRVLIAGVVLLLLVLIMLATGHGPGRHMHSGVERDTHAGAAMPRGVVG